MSNYYNIEAEQSVLGSILIAPDLIYETTLQDKEFYDKSHQVIFNNMVELRDQEKPVDVVSLSGKLGQAMPDIGGIAYLLKLSQSVPTTTNFSTYEKIIKERYVMRSGLKFIKDIYTKEYDDSKDFVSDLLELAEELGDKSHTTGGLEHIGEDLKDHADNIQDKKYNNVKIGASTIGVALDKITGMWQKQTLILIAARPSVGKTAVLLNNAAKNAKEGMAVAIFSLEQPKQQLLDRMIAAEAHIDGSRIKSGQLLDDEWEKYAIASANLSALNIFIDDRPGLSVQEIRVEVRKLKKKYPDLIVYIDYIQLVKGGSKFNNKNRNEEVGYVSSSLKQMARENDCPVVALGQLSRSVEQRQEKRPMLSDLRESGNLEQDADIVAFLYRDDYYNTDTDKKNIIEIIVAKNREGQVGTAEMVNLKNYVKIIDYDFRSTR